MSESIKSLPTVLSAWWLVDASNPVRIGTVRLLPGQRQCAFEFNGSIPYHWITPHPPNTDGEWLPNGAAGMPSFLEDCSPDRWGQLVIRKIERPPRLSPLDYLYMAGDKRFGALGFSTSEDRYVADETPALHLDSLDEIDTLIQRIRAGEKVDERQRRLIRPSKTMGGARPKTLIAIDSELWIAKFPQADDPVDIGRLEFASNRLQQECGIDVIDCDVKPIASGHVFLARRFDRSGNRRIQSISAQTVIQSQDASISDVYSYLLLADGLRMPQSGRPQQDCHELFRRMIFNVLTDNTDDHEKNHSLILNDGRWQLSPSYDAIPQMSGLGSQAMVIGNDGATATLENLMSAYSRFLLDRKAARAICREVAEGLTRWKQSFSGNKVSANDIDTIEQFVDHPELVEMRQSLAVRSISSQP